MNAMQAEYEYMQSGRWAERNPSKCQCHGAGWAVSDLDTLHRCPFHGAGVPHPEDDAEVANFAGHRSDVFRSAFSYFGTEAMRLGFNGSARAFVAACARGAKTLSPEEWVNRAEEIVDDLRSAASESRAMAEGFSCALEARMADEAEQERQERRAWAGGAL